MTQTQTTYRAVQAVSQKRIRRCKDGLSIENAARHALAVLSPDSRSELECRR